MPGTMRTWPERDRLRAVEIGWTWLAASARRAIERTGARFEGVLRNWSPSRAPGEDGKLRDSAMFSVVADEWPAVKSALGIRVAGYPPAKAKYHNELW